ncbi:MAG: hypothetical protein ACLR17_02545 [Enterobacteriaceae bacterium]
MGVYDTGLGIGSQGQQNYIGYAGDIVYKAVSCTVPSTLTVNMGSVPWANSLVRAAPATKKSVNSGAMRR